MKYIINFYLQYLIDTLYLYTRTNFQENYVLHTKWHYVTFYSVSTTSLVYLCHAVVTGKHCFVSLPTNIKQSLIFSSEVVTPINTYISLQLAFLTWQLEQIPSVQFSICNSWASCEKQQTYIPSTYILSNFDLKLQYCELRF